MNAAPHLYPPLFPAIGLANPPLLLLLCSDLALPSHGYHHTRNHARCALSGALICPLTPVTRPRLTLVQTSLDKTGSDAMNAAGDYSAAYCILHTDGQFEGHGMVAPPLLWL